MYIKFVFEVVWGKIRDFPVLVFRKFEMAGVFLQATGSYRPVYKILREQKNYYFLRTRIRPSSGILHCFFFFRLVLLQAINDTAECASHNWLDEDWCGTPTPGFSRSSSSWNTRGCPVCVQEVKSSDSRFLILMLPTLI